MASPVELLQASLVAVIDGIHEGDKNLQDYESVFAEASKTFSEEFANELRALNQKINPAYSSYLGAVQDIYDAIENAK